MLHWRTSWARPLLCDIECDCCFESMFFCACLGRQDAGGGELAHPRTGWSLWITHSCMIWMKCTLNVWKTNGLWSWKWGKYPLDVIWTLAYLCKWWLPPHSCLCDEATVISPWQLTQAHSLLVGFPIHTTNSLFQHAPLKCLICFLHCRHTSWTPRSILKALRLVFSVETRPLTYGRCSFPCSLHGKLQLSMKHRNCWCFSVCLE